MGPYRQKIKKQDQKWPLKVENKIRKNFKMPKIAEICHFSGKLT